MGQGVGSDHSSSVRALECGRSEHRALLADASHQGVLCLLGYEGPGAMGQGHEDLLQRQMKAYCVM